MVEEVTEVVPRNRKWPKKLTASTASMFSACPGSADLPSAIPSWKDPIIKPQGAASVGSKIHLVLAEAAALKRPSMHSLIRALQYFEQLRYQRNFKMLIEVTESATWLPEPVNTTADVVMYLNDELHIVDWKTGAIEVTPYDNDQMMFYAATFAHLAPKAKGVHLHIIQPWCKTWEPDAASVFVTTAEIEAYMNRMIVASQQIVNRVLTLVPGDHCTFCPANPHVRGPKGSPVCPAKEDALYPERAKARAELLEEDEEWFK